MCHWGSSVRGPLGAVIAALLLPGGSLLVVWVLYRKFVSQLVERKP